MAEEELHLQDMCDRLTELGAMDDALNQQFIDLETSLFSKLWDQIEQAEQAVDQAAA